MGLPDSNSVVQSTLSIGAASPTLMGQDALSTPASPYARFERLWHRAKGKPSLDDQALRRSWHEEIVNIAINATENIRQTIRRVYYLCSGQGLVPKGEKGYDIVNTAIGDARWTGNLQHRRINDGGRDIKTPTTWDDADDFMKHVIPWFDMDKWVRQKTRVILAFEKDTISEMLSDVCDKWQIPYVSFHGQASDTIVYELAKLIANPELEDVRFVCLYLGDWDANGLNIDEVVFGSTKVSKGLVDDYSEDVLQRQDDGSYVPYSKLRNESTTHLGKLRIMLLRFFADNQDQTFDVSRVEYRRLGIRASDFDKDEYQGFILEADSTNSMYDRFVEQTGDSRTLGIDALSPETLEVRIEVAVEDEIDKEIWNARAAEIEIERKKLVTP